jgi:hypothetical protein
MIYAIPERPTYDIVFDNIVKILTEYNDAMPTDSFYRFKVVPDQFRAITDLNGAGVFVYWAGNTYTTKGSSARGRAMQYTARYWIDCVSVAPGVKRGESEYVTADAMANARNRFLVHQVVMALFNYGSIDMDLPVGTIGNRPMPMVDPVEPEKLPTELPVAGCRMTLEVEMSDIAQLDDGVPLTELSVVQSNAPAWATFFSYE